MSRTIATKTLRHNERIKLVEEYGEFYLAYMRNGHQWTSLSVNDITGLENIATFLTDVIALLKTGTALFDKDFFDAEHNKAYRIKVRTENDCLHWSAYDFDHKIIASGYTTKPDEDTPSTILLQASDILEEIKDMVNLTLGGV